MKVVCINDYNLSSGKKIFGLTVGKIYDVILQPVHHAGSVILIDEFLIKDDSGHYVWYYSNNLMPIEKLRELKLKELGI